MKYRIFNIETCKFESDDWMVNQLGLVCAPGWEEMEPVGNQEKYRVVIDEVGKTEVEEMIAQMEKDLHESLRKSFEQLEKSLINRQDVFLQMVAKSDVYYPSNVSR